MQPDPKRMTVEEQDMVSKFNQNKQMLVSLEDIASMTNEIIQIFDSVKKAGSEEAQQVGALLTDMRESLDALKSREDPEMPDYAKPVVRAVKEAETALAKAVKAIDVRPEVNVAAPNVTATADVDLRGVEKILKTDLPKSFKDAIKMIPKVEVPKTDLTPLISQLEEMSKQLESIDTAARIKPQMPSSIAVSNLEEIPGGDASASNQDEQTGVLEQIRGFDIPEYDEIELGYTGDDLTTVEYKDSAVTVATLTLAYTGGKLTNVSIS